MRSRSFSTKYNTRMSPQTREMITGVVGSFVVGCHSELYKSIRFNFRGWISPVTMEPQKSSTPARPHRLLSLPHAHSKATGNCNAR